MNINLFFLTSGYIEDFNEDLIDKNIDECFEVTRDSENTKVYTPINSQGILAKNLLDKNQQRLLIQLQTPFASMRSFLPSGIDYGIRLHLTEGENRFDTQTIDASFSKLISVRF